MKYITSILLLTSLSLFGQYAAISPYLAEPARAIPYVDSCAAFWLNAHDPVDGGFFTNIDRTGNVITAWGTNKNMLTQTRNAYGFVRAFQMTGDAQYLQMAREALDFLYQHAWDAVNGGWYGELDRFGNPLNPNGNKGAFDQHYALLGIAAIYEATADSGDWQWLTRGYTHMENHLWDSRMPEFGYYDYGNASWTSLHNKSFNATVDAVTTHLLSLYQLTGDTAYLDRLREMADNMLTHLVGSMNAQAIGFVEKYDSDWNWNNNETLTIMGHVLKTAWCLGRIHQYSPDPAYINGAELLIADVLANGYDHDLGGPYKDYNRTTGQMIMWGNPDTAKAWWQMEQAVTAGLELYSITADTTYLKMADETLHFFMRYFVDHTYGEVYENRTRYGTETWGTHKGGGGKAAYHSIELGYYTYLYGSLFYTNEPVQLHYQFVSQASPRSLRLTPLAISDGQLMISAVLRDGQPYADFDGATRTLNLPAGVGGHFEVTFRTPATGITAGDQPAATNIFTLLQNYPNPFNPATNLEFAIGNSQFVDLSVYDVLGRKVATVVSQTLPAGTYRYQWEAGNLAGGVYLYRLEAGDHVAVRKMMLIR